MSTAARSRRTRGRIEQTRMTICQAIGCADFIPPTAVFCEKHDLMLQADIRTILGKHHRPGKKPTKLFTLMLDRAL